jgi:hypothetical protein
MSTDVLAEYITACYLPQSHFLLRLFFNSEDGGECSSKTLADFQHTIQRYIQENRTLNNYHCETSDPKQRNRLFRSFVIYIEWTLCVWNIPDDGHNRPKYVVHVNVLYVYTRIVKR